MALYYSAVFTTPSPGGSPASTEGPSAVVNYASNARRGKFVVPYSATPGDYYNVVHANMGYYPEGGGCRQALYYACDYVSRARDAFGMWLPVRFRLDLILDHPTSNL